MPQGKQTKRTKRRGRRPRGVADWSGPAARHGPFGIFSNIKLFYVVGALIMAGSLVVGGLTVCTGPSPSAVTPTPASTANATPGAAVTPEETPSTVKQYPAPPPMSLDMSRAYSAVIKTDKGEFSVELFDDDAPNTVNNFVFLARDGFYDGLLFHYVQPEFSVMTGDPTGVGTGGPGYEMAKEESGRPFEVGTLGMVNGSVFFVALAESKQFEAGEFWPFGRVDEGLDVVRQLAKGDRILSVEIIEQ
jgi:cyclophilin family peptidyl-prolyl cis-trans isomerase